MNITFEEFKKVEIRIGKVTKVEKVENADKLLKLQVDFGPEVGERQIVSGIAEYYSIADLEGKKLPFIVNLEPRKFKGVESQGMLMAVDAEKPVLLTPVEDVAEGSEIV
ncbi:MAG TPA: methionine--tRNA ligase subunit beta [Patescibacteria group bacterium]|nr:methionine--tRNA ligase subunit beta [Patescibacteria group bacterium]